MHDAVDALRLPRQPELVQEPPKCDVKVKPAKVQVVGVVGQHLHIEWIAIAQIFANFSLVEILHKMQKLGDILWIVGKDDVRVHQRLDGLFWLGVEIVDAVPERAQLLGRHLPFGHALEVLLFDILLHIAQREVALPSKQLQQRLRFDGPLQQFGQIDGGQRFLFLWRERRSLFNEKFHNLLARVLHGMEERRLAVRVSDVDLRAVRQQELTNLHVAMPSSDVQWADLFGILRIDVCFVLNEQFGAVVRLGKHGVVQSGAATVVRGVRGRAFNQQQAKHLRAAEKGGLVDGAGAFTVPALDVGPLFQQKAYTIHVPTVGSLVDGVRALAVTAVQRAATLHQVAHQLARPLVRRLVHGRGLRRVHNAGVAPEGHQALHESQVPLK
mmetsp:Transcript_18408/g.46818  ORF Transcript_18408/g.46818 Transcript_18408/m.46818 type:complete len:384 (+) Transcript_18408:818-1969(+)